MRLTMCKAKLHRVSVTQSELHYEGSITIDEDLLKAAGILPFEKVQVVNVNNGARFETYTYAGPSGSGMICLNGAAARKGQVGDKLIIIAYCDLEAEEARRHQPTTVLVNDGNSVKEILRHVYP
jgi:aspartate 1-decarboxylase